MIIEMMVTMMKLIVMLMRVTNIYSEPGTTRTLYTLFHLIFPTVIKDRYYDDLKYKKKTKFREVK